ncbi:MAG: DUF481 domain-containing protein [Pseudomonadota bacterium]
MKPIAGALTIAALAAAPLGTLHAQDWSGEGELGYVTTDSETSSNDTFTLKAKVGRESELWRHTAHAEVIYAESETDGVSSKTSDRRFVSWKSDRKLGERHYIYGLVNYEADDVNQLDYRANVSVGYGNQILRGPRHKLDAEIGAGWRETKIAGLKEDEAVLRFAGDYRYNITDASHISEELSVEYGSESTVTRSVTGLSSKLKDNLASKLSYTRQRVDTDEATTDESILAVTIVYSF